MSKPIRLILEEEKEEKGACLLCDVMVYNTDRRTKNKNKQYVHTMCFDDAFYATCVKCGFNWRTKKRFKHYPTTYAEVIDPDRRTNKSEYCLECQYVLSGGFLLDKCNNSGLFSI
jgi:hypothetical protein